MDMAEGKLAVKGAGITLITSVNFVFLTMKMFILQAIHK
jgi:hypothetical protein